MKKLDERGEALLKAIAAEVEKTGSKVKTDSYHWKVTTEEGTASVNIQAGLYWSQRGFRAERTDRLTVSIDGVRSSYRYQSVIARRSFTENGKKPLDLGKIAAHVIHAAKAQAKENKIQEQKQSGYEKSSRIVAKLNKKYPEAAVILSTRDDGDVRLTVDADEAIIEKLLKALS